MKRLFFLACLLLATTLASRAEGGQTVKLDGTEYAVDTTEYYQIAPGSVRFKLRLVSAARTVVAYCTQTNLDHEYATLKAVKGQDRVNGLETVESMLKRSNSRSANTEYVSGVNADYFYMITSFPVSAGNTIVDGEPISSHINPEYGTFCMDGSGAAYLGAMAQNISVKWTGLSTATTIGYLNEPFDDLAVADGQTRPVAIALFTNWCGTNTRTATDGSVTEVVLRLPEGEKLEAGRGKKIVATVVGEPTTKGNSAIPAGCMVLASRDASFVKSMARLTDGTQVTITPAFTIDGVSKASYEFALGGLPMVLKNGKKFKASDFTFDISFATALDPHTLVGYDKSRRHITIAAIDGRQSYSMGLTASEAADLMAHLGCTYAMNFDGGGSTTMYDKNFGLVNKPSGGTQRTVADGLFVCSTAPKDNTVDSIAFMDYRPTVGQGKTYTARIVGYNQYGAVVSTNVAAARLTADAALGTVSGHVVTVKGKPGVYTLTATYGRHTITQTLRVVEADEDEEIPDVDNGTASRGQFAYKLDSQLKDDTYTFTFYLTGKADVDLYLTNALGDTVTYDVGPKVAGKNTFQLMRSEMPEGDWNWAIAVVSDEGTAAKPFFTGVPKSPRGVAINVNPLSAHFQEMYSFDPYSAAKGMFITRPDLTAANTSGYNSGMFTTTGMNHPVRGTINYNNDYIYWSSWNDSPDGGVFMANPNSPSTKFTQFFSGTMNSDGRVTNNGQIVGGSTCGVSIVGTGDETTLWAFEEDVPSAGRPSGQNLCRYDIGGQRGVWSKAPSAIYDAPSALMPNTNVNVVATRRGIFLAQWRGTGNNSADAPSFIVCDMDGKVLFNSSTLLATLQGSYIGGLAVSDDCSRMAIANGNGNINLYAIKWDAAGKPSFRYRYAITNKYGRVYAMQFDFGGNLFAATETGLIGFTVPYFQRLAVTPAPLAQTVSGTMQSAVGHIAAPTTNAPLYDLSGKPASGAKKGIFVRNGKKVLLK